MSCERFEALISARLDRALSAEESREIEAHLAACAACRRADGEYVRLAAELEAAFLAEPAPARRRPRRVLPVRRRPRARRATWPAAAGAIAAAAAALIAALWLAPSQGRARVAAGRVYENGTEVRALAAGRLYRAGDEGARVPVPGGGELELAGGAAFELTGRGLDLRAGEARCRDAARAEFRAGPLRAEALAASLALTSSSEGARADAAVVVLSGQVTVAGSDGVRGPVEPGQAVSCGWGVPERPRPVGELAAALAGRRELLAPAAELDRYRRIVAEYEHRLAEFRREMTGRDPASAEALDFRSRLESLAECKKAHEARLGSLEADAAERARIDRRIEFLERSGEWSAEMRETAAGGPEPRPAAPAERKRGPLALSGPETAADPGRPGV